MSVARRTSPWLAAVLFASALAVVLLVALPRRDSSTPLTPSLRAGLDPLVYQQVCALLSAPPGGPAPEAQAIAREIHALGSAALPIAIDLACGAQPLPENDLGTAGEALHPQSVALRERALRMAIASFPARELLMCLRERAEGAELGVRRVLIQFAGEVEHDDALRTLLALAEAIEPIHWRRDYIVKPFEAACTARLSARPEGVRELRSRLRNLDPGLVTALARSAARVPTTITLELVGDLLGRDDELDLALLGELARLPAARRPVVGDELLARVRNRIGASNPRVHRAAIDAAGSLGDPLAVEDILASLEHEDPVIAQSAHRALVSILPLDCGRSSEPWQRWLDEEGRWYELQAPTLLERMAGEELAPALSAMRELAAHPLYRDEVAEALAERLDGAPGVTRAAIEALAATGSARGIPPLMEALSSDDPPTALRARDALRRLTGLSLGGDPEVWRAALAR